MDRIQVMVSALALFLFLATPGSDLLVAQEEGGVIEGLVWDSTARAPLPDARVVLWDTEHSASSDEEGRFRIDGLQPGEYSLAFFHTRLGVLGISSGTRRVSLERGERREVVLAIPSKFTILAAGCVLEERRTGYGGRVVGRVQDSPTGVALPESRVTLTFNPSHPAPGAVRTLEVQVDPDGWWRICSVPEGIPIGASASFLNRRSHRRQFELPPGGLAHVDLTVGDSRPAVVSGRLTDVRSTDPVEGAEVLLVGTNDRAVSDGSGRFQFRDLAPGEYTLQVSHLAYGSRVESLDLESGMVHEVTVNLSQEPIDLPPITVTVSAVIPQTELAMGGQVITQEEIRAVRERSASIGDLIKFVRVSGLSVRKVGGALTCLEFMVGQTRMKKRACEYPMIFVDGIHVTAPSAVLDMPPGIVERMQVFRPVEAGTLFGLGAGQGVVMIWTKSGTRP